MKQVGVLAVTYNRLKLLKEEIESIRKQNFRDFDIIVVNNCSTDDTKEWLKNQDDITTINIEPENIGPARAFAQGMKYIAEHGYKYCWLMDDDVECYPNALQELYDAYNENDDTGFVCSNVIGLDGCPMNVPVVDNRISSNGYSDYAKFLDRGMLKIIRCTFVSMFLSCQSIFDEGLPYGEFYNWAVDTEFSRRLSSQKECFLVGKSIVIHKRKIQGDLSFETETDPVRLSYYRSHYRNLIYVSMKYDIKGGKDRLRYFLQYTFDLLSLLSRLQFSHLKVKILAVCDYRRFKPVIKYPALSKQVKF